MAEPLELLKTRLDSADRWLIRYGDCQYDDRDILTLAERYCTILQQYPTPAKILLADRHPGQFLAGFIAACTTRSQLFLGNPDWGNTEWQQVFDQVQPNLIWADAELIDRLTNTKDYGLQAASKQIPNHQSENIQFSQIPPLPTEQTLVMIPTGGTSGKLRWAMHTWESLSASVVGFQHYFQTDHINSCCVLPLYHVSGLMQFMRSVLSGGQLILLPWKVLKTLGIADLDLQVDLQDCFLSLVPTQLQQLLEQPHADLWMTQLQAVLIGGAPLWQELLNQARSRHWPIAPTYGMTETASQIATLKPGSDSCLLAAGQVGQALPHVEISIQDSQGQESRPGEVGQVVVRGRSVMLGYYPEIRSQLEHITDDLGFFDEHNSLYIVGRNSHKIMTGGENVYPQEVEAAIYATQMVREVCVLGLPDLKWGEVVAAVYVPYDRWVKGSKHQVAELETALVEQLSPYKLPKYWIAVEAIPHNAQGKLDRLQIRQVAIAQIAADRGHWSPDRR